MTYFILTDLYLTEFKRTISTNPKPTMEIYPAKENNTEFGNSTIYTSTGDVVLNTGENFTIECFGDYPIKLIIQRGRNHAVRIGLLMPLAFASVFHINFKSYFMPYRFGENCQQFLDIVNFSMPNSSNVSEITYVYMTTDFCNDSFVLQTSHIKLQVRRHVIHITESTL